MMNESKDNAWEQVARDMIKVTRMKHDPNGNVYIYRGGRYIPAESLIKKEPKEAFPPENYQRRREIKKLERMVRKV
jgi:hypothetical protein